MRASGEQPSVKTADTGRMWTKGLWDGIPWDQIQAGQREGGVFFDDFKNMPAFAALDSDVNKYATYSDTGTTIDADANDENGAVSVALDATDNDEGWIQTGGNTGGMAKLIKMGTAVPHTIAFECRVKKSSITTGGLFVGLGDPGLAAINTIVDGGTLADANFVGFQVPEADADGMDFTYKADGQTQQVIVADINTMVADAYVKAGFVYNYKGPNDKQIKVYKNGVLNNTGVTKANIDAVTFPESDDLALLFGGKNSSAAANTFTMDWWKFAMVVNA